MVIMFRSIVDQKVGGSNPGSSKLLFHFNSLISSHSGSNSALSSPKNELKTIHSRPALILVIPTEVEIF